MKRSKFTTNGLFIPLNVDPIKIALGVDLEKYNAIKFIQCKWNLICGQGAEAENVPLCLFVSTQHFPPTFFPNTPQSSHLQVTSSISSLTELPGCLFSYFSQVRKRSGRLWGLSEEWTLDVLAIIVLNAPMCKCLPPPMWNDVKLPCSEVIFAPHGHYVVLFYTIAQGRSMLHVSEQV